MCTLPPAIARIAHASLPARLLLLHIHRPIARCSTVVVAPAHQALILILVPIIIEVETELRPPTSTSSQSIALLQMWTAGFDAAGQAVPNGSEAWPDVVLREDVDGRLRRLVRGFERCADVVQATPEPRVVGAIHGRGALGGADGGGGEGDDDGRVVEMAVVSGGMRTGARADVVNQWRCWRMDVRGVHEAARARLGQEDRLALRSGVRSFQPGGVRGQRLACSCRHGMARIIIVRRRARRYSRIVVVCHVGHLTCCC